MSTLKNLVNKGVKVELGVPYELWDEPSVEVADMKRQVIHAHAQHANMSSVDAMNVNRLYTDLLGMTFRIQLHVNDIKSHSFSFWGEIFL